MSGREHDLATQVAIVTGASRGVGRAVAEALSAAGASVALAARSRRQLEEVATGLERVLVAPTDVTDAAAVGALVEETERRLGPPTLLVSNAGAWRSAGPLWEADPAAWWEDVEVSLRGAFLCARAVLPGMLARGSGRVVNVSSYAANGPRPYASGYAAGKAAVLRLTDSLAAELGGTGVHAFAISPGFVRTELVGRVLRSPQGRRWLPELAERQDALEPERAGRLVVDIASGRLDALAGRFLHVLDDVDDLAARAEEIRARDLYALRMQT